MQKAIKLVTAAAFAVLLVSPGLFRLMRSGIVRAASTNGASETARAAGRNAATGAEADANGSDHRVGSSKGEKVAGAPNVASSDSSSADPNASPCPGAEEPDLPLPSSLPADEYQKLLLNFLANHKYSKWCHDKTIRDTGPYVDGQYLGTHPAVRVYYSPNVMKWLLGGRNGSIPDGSMIIKEMFSPGPAERWIEQQPVTAANWTVMVKDAKTSKEGWYWGGLWVDPKNPMPLPSDNYKPPFSYPSTGYGLSCMHCHASADKESTFATLNNIEGYPGEPLTFFIGDWRAGERKTCATSPEDGADVAPGHREHPLTFKEALSSVETPAKFAEELLKSPKAATPLASVPRPPELQVMPGETYDHIFAGEKGSEAFLTSDQCQVCHSGNAWYGGKNLMILDASSKNPVNVSPYGEWRWSPMGLAGRDPVFYAQFASEQALAGSNTGNQHLLSNTCFSCHGVMGKRQLDIDHQGGGAPNFDPNVVFDTNLNSPDFKYGALARDGISCMVCHRTVEDKAPPGADPLKYFLDNDTTGKFKIAEPGKTNELFGPFKENEISPLPMKNSLGVDPKQNDYIKDSRLCGSCHTITLPILDNPNGGESIEQATYLEWLNSQYQTEFSPGPNAKSCQDCHLPNNYQNNASGVKVNPIQSVIADIEDDTYPAAENRAPLDKINVRYRKEGFVRHQMQGLNVFMLEMFNQFMTPDSAGNYSNDILGVRKSDYMSTLNNDLDNAISNFVQTAQNDSASVTVSPPVVDSAKQALVASVTVTNKTGHRFPSGVGFRRAFIDFDVIDNGQIDPTTGRGKIVWSSGHTDEDGLIVDNSGSPLITEFIGTPLDPGRQFQPHFYGSDHPITKSSQVQIYEELVKDASGDFTTSFVRRDDTHIKDNRLLPIGWNPNGPSPSLSGRYLEATFPEGDARKDPNYANGSGTSQVWYEVPLRDLPQGIDMSKVEIRATLYYQSIPPYYLMQRFEDAPTAPGTLRFLYLAAGLHPQRTPIEGWKLKIVSAKAAIKQ